MVPQVPQKKLGRPENNLAPAGPSIGGLTPRCYTHENYIFPKIVGSKVRLNALVSIIVVLAFRALWGVPGMFLSIPLTAIIKVICDHIESLKPWGFLLGDNSPPLLIKMPKKFTEKKESVES